MAVQERYVRPRTVLLAGYLKFSIESFEYISRLAEMEITAGRSESMQGEAIQQASQLTLAGRSWIRARSAGGHLLRGLGLFAMFASVLTLALQTRFLPAPCALPQLPLSDRH